MRCQFIEGRRQEFATRLRGRVLGVSTGGYDRWRRPASARRKRGEALVAEIKAIPREVKARHGGPRVHAELVARAHSCRVNAVAKLKSRAGVAAETKPKYRCTTDSNHDHPVAENVVDRQFEPEAPNRVWTADITSIPTREGRLDLAAVGDLRSRQVVGWAMGDRGDSRRGVDAREMAVSRRLPGEGLVAHSDRGGQYASERYGRVPSGHGIACGMSRRANRWDDAPIPMGSFFAGLKKELVHDEDYRTRAEARASHFEDIEVFSNRVRRHPSLGYRSPIEYERAG